MKLLEAKLGGLLCVVNMHPVYSVGVCINKKQQYAPVYSVGVCINKKQQYIHLYLFLTTKFYVFK